MSDERPRTGGFHDDDDVERALRDLTPGDHKRLRAAAYALVRGLRLDTGERDHDDLYSETFRRTLAGSRRWRRGVDFLRHLLEAMRSIAWAWHEHSRVQTRAGEVGWRSDLYIAGVDSPESQLLDAERLAAVQRRFTNDRAAGAVMNAWEMGRQLPQLVESGWDMTDLQAAVRRIRRFAQRGDGDG